MDSGGETSNSNGRNRNHQSRGRSGSRASSTSSSLEVRCACQYFRSDSLLPERSALAACRPAAKYQAQRMVQTPPAGRRQPVKCGDHDYEPIGQPMMRLAVSHHSVVVRSIAPVVKITDTDVAPVADSDDSLDEQHHRYRFQHGALILDGDVIVPLDGRIEDDAMDGRNLGDQTTIDTSADELEESPQQLQDRLEERYFNVSANNGERNGLDRAPPAQQQQQQQQRAEAIEDHEARPGLQQRLKSQAGKIRSRFKNIQKPNFKMARSGRQPAAKPTEKKKSGSVTLTVSPAKAAPVQSSSSPPAPEPTATETETPKPPPSPRGTQKASRMERFRMALPERPRFSLPDKSKFHLPERPKFNLPDRSKFHIKKPNIHLPKSLSRQKASTQPPTREPSETNCCTDGNESTKSAGGAPKRSIFDFSTLPRPKKLFERKPKQPKQADTTTTTVTTVERIDYVTSSPKDSRAQSIESSTFPRAKKSSGLSLSARWAQRFGETVRGFHGDAESKESAVDRSKPWRHPSLDEPRLSLKPQTSRDEEEDEEGEGEQFEERLPWEDAERRVYVEQEEIIYADRDDGIKEPTPTEEKDLIKDPKLDDEQLMNHLESEEPKKKVRLVEDQEQEVEYDERAESQTYHPKELYDSSFQPVDPPDFHDERAHSVELSEEEEEDEGSMRSDREIQQSSGSSCDRRRRGVIEEIDSDEFFLREKGISEENMRFHLISEIRDALQRPRNMEQDEEELGPPPVRPKRARSARKRRDLSADDSSTTPRSIQQQQSFERAGSLSSRHRIVYHTESSSREVKDGFGHEDYDYDYDDDGRFDRDAPVVKPARRRSRGSLRSASHGRLPIDEQNIVLAPIGSGREQQPEVPPVAPSRRKRLRRDQSSSLSIRTVDSAMYNGFAHSNDRIPPTPPPTPPAYPQRHPEDELDYIEPAARRIEDERHQQQQQQQHQPPPPIPPKRTRSRTASLAPEDDRTSHGADSLPGDFGFVDDEIEPPTPREYSTSREPSLPGYAVIDKREKPPRPPPPRRKKHKFATAPRPAKSGPKRPLRNYSTLRPAKSETIRSSDSMPFIDGDFPLRNHEESGSEEFHRDLQSGEILSKIQGRPLPAPPRPPRHRRPVSQQQQQHLQPQTGRHSSPREITPDISETVASTQTDPLPDDLVIEEELEAITTAKLVVAPSRSGSTHVLISTESPGSGSYRSAATPPIPPLPQQSRDVAADGDRKAVDRESERKQTASDEPRRFDPSQLEILRSALFSTDEPLRIPSLEVGDLRVERLTVSQLEAYKVAASEIDAIVVSATELSNKGETETGIHPSLLQELIAIRSQLEAVTSAQPHSRPHSSMEDAYTATSNERVDIPIDEQQQQHQQQQQQQRRREKSPLLVVEGSVTEKDATMGRTAFPLTTSASDSPSSITVSDTTTIVTTEVVESVITISDMTAELTRVKPDEGSSTTTTTSTASAAIPSTTTSAPDKSRSSSPSRPGFVRQTASPVQSLPPVISVTPDAITTTITALDGNVSSTPLRHTDGVQPQRATISYNSSTPPALSRETSQSPPPPPSSSPTPRDNNPQVQQHTQYIAFPTSHIPPEFFALANPPLTTTTDQQQQQQVPSVAETAGQLLRALRHAGNRSLRHFVDSLVERFGGSDDEDENQDTESGQKIRRVELALCALLVLVACLIAVCICTPRTVTHHHHWDYFNPPQ